MQGLACVRVFVFVCVKDGYGGEMLVVTTVAIRIAVKVIVTARDSI